MSGRGGSARGPVSPRKARIVTAITLGVLALAGAGMWQAVAKFGAIDACLADGGAWHDASGRCAEDLEAWRALETEAGDGA